MFQPMIDHPSNSPHLSNTGTIHCRTRSPEVGMSPVIPCCILYQESLTVPGAWLGSVTPPKAGPGCAGVPARTFPRGAVLAGRRGHRAPLAGVRGFRDVRARTLGAQAPPPAGLRCPGAAANVASDPQPAEGEKPGKKDVGMHAPFVAAGFPKAVRRHA